MMRKTAPASQAALGKSQCSATATDTDTSGSERSIDGTPLRPSAGDDDGAARLSLAALRISCPDVPAGDDAGASPSAPPRRPRSPVPHQSATREMIESMRDAVVDAAAHSSSSLRREAIKAHSGDPLKTLRGARRLELAPARAGVRAFQCKKARTATTRVLALAPLHAPIHEVVAVLSHRSALSLPLLNPGLAAFETLHTLVDKPTEYVAVKSLVMHDQWNAPHIAHAREFVVIESQQAFQTDDGRRGWAVSYHSLVWPGCPEPPRGAVRGSVYNTGVVALERVRRAELIDVFSVAEFKLKGGARARADWTAAKDRALDVLALLTGTVEQRAVGELELLETSAYAAIERHTELGPCSLCEETSETKKETYRCRKCCVSVCGSCSATWRRGSKAMRLCLDCWGDTPVEF